MVASSAIRQAAVKRNSGMATSPTSPEMKQASRTPEYELALLERVCGGEKHLFYELIQPYERSVFIAAQSVLQNEADAEEVAQEAFLKAFAHLASFRRESKFSTWLIQIAINEARMKRRKDRKGLYESIDQQQSGDEGDYFPRDFAVWREIPNYIDGEIDPELRRRMEEHFKGCEHCSAVLDGTKNVVRLVGDGRVFDLPAGFSDRLKSRLQKELKD